MRNHLMKKRPAVIDKLFFSDKRYDLGEVGRYRINKKLLLNTDMDTKVLTKEDITEIIKYLDQACKFKNVTLMILTT
jgi:DNA-directed RNA polymerase subunit beta